MAAEKTLHLKKPLPKFKVNEGSEMDPIDLHWYIESLVGEEITFTAGLTDGSPLPDGVICTDDGAFGGTPEAGTASPVPYRIEFTAETESGVSLTSTTVLRVYDVDHPIGKTGFFLEEADEAVERVGSEKEDTSELYAGIPDYWKKFSEGEVPDIQAALTRGMTKEDMYYLLSRYMTLTVWNADDLSVPKDGKCIKLPEMSERFLVYDFGVALVITPRELFSGERSLQDGIATARALAKEIHKRGWDIELAGFDKLVTAFWVAANQINRLGKGHLMKIKNYEPTATDYATLSHELKAESTNR